MSISLTGTAIFGVETVPCCVHYRHRTAMLAVQNLLLVSSRRMASPSSTEMRNSGSPAIFNALSHPVRSIFVTPEIDHHAFSPFLAATSALPTRRIYAALFHNIWRHPGGSSGVDSPVCPTIEMTAKKLPPKAAIFGMLDVTSRLGASHEFGGRRRCDSAAGGRPRA